jgi:hypothetical protein
MSLADDMAPEACIGVCVETIEESLKDALQNAPLPGEDSDEAARKYVILGKCFRTIKEYTKEALKSVQYGQDSTAFVLIRASAHKTLDEFDDTAVTITGPDGHEVQTTVGRFNEICEAVQQDPGLVDRVLGGEQ